MEYVVGKRDTLERVAASHDLTPSELMKYNRMSSRTIFEGFFSFINVFLSIVFIFV